jgi:hypothetical protein
MGKLYDMIKEAETKKEVKRHMKKKSREEMLRQMDYQSKWRPPDGPDGCA